MDLISAAAERDQLRQEFPVWGIFHDPYAEHWYAVPGVGTPVVAGSPNALRRRLLGGDPGVDPKAGMATRPYR